MQPPPARGILLVSPQSQENCAKLEFSHWPSSVSAMYLSLKLCINATKRHASAAIKYIELVSGLSFVLQATVTRVCADPERDSDINDIL